MQNRSVILATKTLQAIDRAIEADQGAAYRQNLQRVLPHIGDAYRGEDVPFRSHMGASIIGNECGRAIWYTFHWTTRPHFKGRLLRLFNRGHLEEGRLIAALLTIGCQVYQQDENGKQFRISDAGGHFGGSGDGVAFGPPDIPPGTAALLEFKTHNDKSFKKLQAEGVRSAKFEHYVQMQTYMRKMGLTCALYAAVNKNDDDLYMEVVLLNAEFADQFLDRGRTLVFMREAPKRLSESPGWFACKWCDHHAVCHNGAAPAVNCRTCKMSEPRADGLWYCNLNAPGRSITTEEQLKGCDEYRPF